MGMASPSPPRPIVIPSTHTHIRTRSFPRPTRPISIHLSSSPRPSTNYTFFQNQSKKKRKNGNSSSIPKNPATKPLQTSFVQGLFGGSSSPIGPTAGSTSSGDKSPDRVKWDYRGQRKVITLGQWIPKTAVDAYVAPNAVLAGQVVVYDRAVLRDDLNKITVGFCSNVQERCVVHAAWSSPTGLPAETLIERFVTVGAYSLLRSCTIEPECIIGQHSILMEGSLVETYYILEAGSVVPPGRRIPTGELWAGNPASSFEI